MIDHIKQKIQSLKHELDSINHTNSIDNLTLHKYDQKRRLEIISKIQVLNEIIMSYK